MRWSDGGARPAIPDVAILVIYENRQGQLGYITNCTAISAYTSEMQSGQPIVLHEIVAGPPDGGDGDTERSGKHMAKVLRIFIAS